MEESVDIMLPVAGFVTRLRPRTWTKPATLTSIAGKPMLEHMLDWERLPGPVQYACDVGLPVNQTDEPQLA